MVIERERHGQVAVVRIHRPEARNAVNGAVAQGMEAALDDAEADDDVRAVVVTGSDTVFSAGADLKLIASGGAAEMFTPRGGFAGIVRRDFPKPLVAAVVGPALAGGFEIALACDLVVAAETARFGLPEVQRGLLAGAGGVIRLPSRVPRAIALELCITGEPIDASRAGALGLVNRVVPTHEVLDVALGLGKRIADNAPVAVRNTLRLARAGTNPTEAEAEAWERNDELMAEVMASRDAIEGAVAFAEKRPPRWTGT